MSAKSHRPLPIASAPLNQYKYLVSVWQGGLGSPCRLYGAHDLESARNHVLRCRGEWSIYEMDGLIKRLVEES